MTQKTQTQTEAHFEQEDISARRGVVNIIAAHRVRGSQKRVRAHRVVNWITSIPATLNIGPWKATGLAVVFLTIIVIVALLLKRGNS